MLHALRIRRAKALPPSVLIARAWAKLAAPCVARVGSLAWMPRVHVLLDKLFVQLLAASGAPVVPRERFVRMVLVLPALPERHHVERPAARRVKLAQTALASPPVLRVKHPVERPAVRQVKLARMGRASRIPVMSV